MGRFDKFMAGVNETLDAVTVYATKVQTVRSLMEMSEASGLKRLDALVPRITREGWTDDLLILLSAQEHDNTNTAETQRKARTFHLYANDLWQNEQA